MKTFYSLLICVSVLGCPFGSVAQVITNYTLGKGYQYFKSSSKATIIADIGYETQGSSGDAKMRGNPYFFRVLSEEQANDKKSLLSILRQKNPVLANEYEAQLDALSDYFNNGIKNEDGRYTFIFPHRGSENPELYYRRALWLTALLETYSEYYKNLQNINSEMETEQAALNEAYQGTLDSITHSEREKYQKELDLCTEKLKILQKDSNNPENEFAKIARSIENKYSLEVSSLKKEKQVKIDQLPQANFIQNKKAIIQKYDILIAEKIAQQHRELEVAASRFKKDNEFGMQKYQARMSSLRNRISELNSRIENISNNLETTLPPPPSVDDIKYNEKIEKIKNETNLKLSTIKINNY